MREVLDEYPSDFRRVYYALGKKRTIRAINVQRARMQLKGTLNKRPPKMTPAEMIKRA
jgi:hypothetical protein